MKTAKPWERIRARKIPLKPSRSAVKFGPTCGHPVCHFPWEKATAFAANPRGVLVHRVRHVDTILWSGVEHHHHVSYLCGNGCNVGLGDIADVLVADPPTDRLLCVACEARAAREKLPSGDVLAGRHVHLGVLVPRQVCCGAS